MSDHWKDQPRVPSGSSEGGQWTDEAIFKSSKKASGIKDPITPYHVKDGKLRSIVEMESYEIIDEDEVSNGTIIAQSARPAKTYGETIYFIIC